MEQFFDINTGVVTQADVTVSAEEAKKRADALLANNWAALRIERDRRLALTDYLALADATLSDDMRTYRQALRDLPANTSDPASPSWPTKPEA